MLIAGNWKMHTDLGGAVALARAVVEAVGEPGVDVAVCPPFISLDAVYGVLRASPLRLGAQDVSEQAAGAYTGDVSAAMVRSVGCTYALVGHSERRAGRGDTDTVVGHKLRRALDAGLAPVLCVGETLGERRAGQETAVATRQLAAALDGVAEGEAARVVVAYEPVWAIGTGETATPAQAQAMHAAIRAWLADRFGAGAAKGIPLLYGGSVKADNAADLFGQPDVDGALVGGASLKAADFAAIVRAAEDVQRRA